MIRQHIGRALAAIGLSLAFAAPALAQTAAAPARAVLMDPLTLSKLKDMDYGWVAPPDAGFVVMTYDVNDGSECTPTAGLLRGGACEAAEFAGLGSLGQRIRVRLPERRRVFLTGPGQRIRVDQMDIYLGEGLNRLSPAGRRNQRFRITGVDGEFFFRVGGRMRIRANQAPGIYEGTFNVQIDYR